jgi:hypothetical protein
MKSRYLVPELGMMAWLKRRQLLVRGTAVQRAVVRTGGVGCGVGLKDGVGSTGLVPWYIQDPGHLYGKACPTLEVEVCRILIIVYLGR